ncbi:hypothetical protein SVA_2788 [Sulfurifustis variabilis]|uniref:Pyridoxamine 5'-phosphate oxidase n=1 Tax=Sulfurifustis variabilis TaxID=1675686 RepID=A0A1B4V724_9GAMM|nr:hypothetical protein [Sulfurifustis variabilis]BAU49336.1 hypothetical protein SVA_2788 [Sulfurifustis variabilis]
MTPSPTGVPLLDEARAAFLTRRVAINVASCSAELVPSVSRAVGCRVSPDRRRVTVFLSVPRSTALLDDLRAGRGIAVVFSLPSTHETIQLKGARAAIVPLEDGDRECMKAYAASFIDELRHLGYRDPFATAIMSAVGEDATGVEFEPTAAFLQTPGPTAGRRLEPAP